MNNKIIQGLIQKRIDDNDQHRTLLSQRAMITRGTVKYIATMAEKGQRTAIIDELTELLIDIENLKETT